METKTLKNKGSLFLFYSMGTRLPTHPWIWYDMILPSMFSIKPLTKFGQKKNGKTPVSSLICASWWRYLVTLASISTNGKALVCNHLLQAKNHGFIINSKYFQQSDYSEWTTVCRGLMYKKIQLYLAEWIMKVFSFITNLKTVEHF